MKRACEIATAALAVACTACTADAFSTKASDESASVQSVTWTVTGVPQEPGVTAGLRGSIEPLSWDESQPLARSATGFSIQLDFAESVDRLEYKYVLETSSGVVWEAIDNRTVQLNAAQSDFRDIWDTNAADAARAGRLLQPEDLAGDLGLVRTAILDVHPGAYRYRTRPQLEAAFENLEVAFSEPITQREAYFALSRFLAYVQCDHTYANFYNQSGAVRAQILGERDKLPFALDWYRGELVVTASALDEVALPAGTRIVSINGRSSAELGEDLLAFIPADGPAMEPRLAKAGVTGYRFTNDAFDVFQPYLIAPLSASYEIKVLEPSASDQRTLVVPAITRLERSAGLEARYFDWPRRPEDLWRFTDLGDGTALISIGTFVSWRFETGWQVYLEEFFEAANTGGFDRLIIDIRGNTGGSDAPASALLSHIVQDSCTIPGLEDRARYRVFPSDLAEVSSSWSDAWRNLGDIEPIGDGVYRVSARAVQVVNPAPDAFGGSVIMLTGPSNASGGFYTARAAQACGITRVGQSTGGSQQGINGGLIVFVRLPASGLQFDVPIIGTFSNDQADPVGIAPNVEIVQTPQATALGHDLVLEAALHSFE